MQLSDKRRLQMLFVKDELLSALFYQQVKFEGVADLPLLAVCSSGFDHKLQPMASYCGRCLLCRVGDSVGCIDGNCTTATTASQNHCRGGAVAAAAVVVLHWTRPRLALIRKNDGSSDTGLIRISESNNFPQVVLLTVGSATCAAHIALGIVEDHARVFHSEDFETCLVVLSRLHSHFCVACKPCNADCQLHFMYSLLAWKQFGLLIRLSVCLLLSTAYTGYKCTRAFSC